MTGKWYGLGVAVLALLMTGGMAGAQSGFDYEAPYTNTAPTIDGSIDEGEYPAEAIVLNPTTLDDLGGTMNTGDSPNEAEYWLVWDDDALYMAARVSDPNVVYNGTQGDALNNTDGVQLATDHQLLQEGGSDTPGIHIHDIVPGQADDNDTAAYWQHWNGNPPDTFPNAEWGGRTTSEGYEVELMLPWGDFEPETPTPATGMQMGFLLLMMDFDGEDDQLDLWWTGDGGIGNPADWNVLTLGDTLDQSLSVSIDGPTLVALGTEVALTANVGNAEGEVSYQWYKDGTELDGEVFETLLISEVVETDEGTYTVVVEDDGNTAEDSFELTIGEALPVASLVGVLLLALMVVAGGLAMLRQQRA